MGIFDNIGEQVAQHGETIDQAIEKGAEFIDEKTGGKHSEQINQAADFVKDKVDNLASKKEGEEKGSRVGTADLGRPGAVLVAPPRRSPPRRSLTPHLGNLRSRAGGCSLLRGAAGSACPGEPLWAQARPC